jgi:hypothetical protein
MGWEEVSYPPLLEAKLRSWKRIFLCVTVISPTALTSLELYVDKLMRLRKKRHL